MGGASAPKVSVLLSIYRPDERYLAKQLDSIDAQSCDSIEVIVYNDCPDDPSWEDFCRTHVTHHELVYMCGEENLGYVGAFERLLGLARGRYCVFCDQDDIWLPGRVEKGVAPLEDGCLMSVVDRQIIDSDDRVLVKSWRAAHPTSRPDTWKTGDRYVPHAAFACYGIGMAMAVETQAARSQIPLPRCTGHDKWLALVLNQMGRCAFVEEPLVQYRRYGSNVTGTLSGIKSKRDWYEKRIIPTYQLVSEFAHRFPDCPELCDMLDFAKARMMRDIWGLWAHRDLMPLMAKFEIAQAVMPDVIFRRLCSR